MYFYNFFLYWPPFHVFHINLDMMECFVKFPPPLYSCQTHHLALLKPPLPAKQQSTTITQYSFSCSLITKNMNQSFHSSHSNLYIIHTALRAFTHTHTHTAVATRVLGRAKRDAGGTVWVRGGAVQLFPPRLLQIEQTLLSDQP